MTSSQPVSAPSATDSPQVMHEKAVRTLLSTEVMPLLPLLNGAKPKASSGPTMQAWSGPWPFLASLYSFLLVSPHPPPLASDIFNPARYTGPQGLLLSPRPSSAHTCKRFPLISFTLTSALTFPLWHYMETTFSVNPSMTSLSLPSFIFLCKIIT